MDISFNHKEINRDIFDNVLTGQVFLIEEGNKSIPFLRTTGGVDEYGNVVFNVVNLKTGELDIFSSNEPVIFPEDMEFIITY